MQRAIVAAAAALALTVTALVGCSSSPTPEPDDATDPQSSAATTADGGTGDDTAPGDSSADTTAGDTDTAPAADADPASGSGTQDDPYSTGGSFTLGNWTIVVDPTTFNADDVVAAGSTHNDAAPAGSQYIQVPAHITNGGTSSATSFEVLVAYVTASGEVYDSSSTVAMVEGGNTGQLLEPGDSLTFSTYIIVPSDGVEQGLVRVTTVLADDGIFVALA